MKITYKRRDPPRARNQASTPKATTKAKATEAILGHPGGVAGGFKQKPFSLKPAELAYQSNLSETSGFQT